MTVIVQPQVAADWQPMHPLPPVFPFGWAVAHGEDRHGLWQAFEVNGVRQAMRWIPPGRFMMGSPTAERGRQPDEPQRPMHIHAGFWLADTACALALWVEVLGIAVSADLSDRDFPAARVSWLDVTNRFLPSLDRRLRGFTAALPTDAQWEYACRAGTSTPFWFGERVDPSQVNDGGGPVPVKTLPANGWGLYEMHGNVAEWCADLWAPELPVRVLRGGSYKEPAVNARSAARGSLHAQERLPWVGFRLAHPALPA